VELSFTSLFFVGKMVDRKLYVEVEQKMMIVCVCVCNFLRLYTRWSSVSIILILVERQEGHRGNHTGHMIRFSPSHRVFDGSQRTSCSSLTAFRLFERCCLRQQQQLRYCVYSAIAYSAMADGMLQL